MGKEKVGLVALVIIVSSWCVTSSSYSSSSSFRGDLSRGKAPSTFGSVSSSLVLNRVGSSVVLPLHGNVYPTGSYNVTVYIGQPPKPYFLDPDTGSDLTWLQCNAPCVRCTPTPHPLYPPSDDLVDSSDQICRSLQPSNNKSDRLKRCSYGIQYADGGSTRGFLVKDVIDFDFKSNRGGVLSPRVALGCGYDQIPSPYTPCFDGVLGLGKGESSIVSQLSSQGLVANVVGHCLSTRGGGFLFFGDGLYNFSRITWRPLSYKSKRYSPVGTAELFFAGKPTGQKNLKLLFDSGSTYTYFSSKAYEALSSRVKNELIGKPFTEIRDPDLPLCWKCRKSFKDIRDVTKYFKPFALTFNRGESTESQFEVPPESYLIRSVMGNVCMGVLNGTQAGLKDRNLIGDTSMLDKMVIYDNANHFLGWASEDCSQLPKSRAFAA
ncbi:hypothetical protein EUGRSUZ_H05087 [Eucalyptus grandis]|uniref:Uncharacterized protein n=2 Tax=Eucalyptus grandis TaxID=71139 RepID=A0ACC3K0D3_EUCGR|nr:hypothetical protein EUGRSUZ_H05087 [Eucalyptus grandis]